MTTAYPGAVDALRRPSTTDAHELLADLIVHDNVDDIMDAVEAIETKLGATASLTAGTGVAIAETASQNIHRSVITMTDVSVTVSNTTGVSFGGTKIVDFPAGVITVLSSVCTTAPSYDFTDAGNVTPIAGTHGGDWALGTTVAGDGTLTGTDVDIIPSTDQDPLSTGVGNHLAAGATFDGSSTAVDVYFNQLIDDADVADGASDVLLVSGVFEIVWILAGDY